MQFSPKEIWNLALRIQWTPSWILEKFLQKLKSSQISQFFEWNSRNLLFPDCKNIYGNFKCFSNKIWKSQLDFNDLIVMLIFLRVCSLHHSHFNVVSYTRIVLNHMFRVLTEIIRCLFKLPAKRKFQNETPKCIYFAFSSHREEFSEVLEIEFF